MGLILDAAGDFSFESFRLAWTVQYAIWILAVVGILITRRKARTLIGVPLVTERIWSLLVGRRVSKCKVGRGAIGGCVVQEQFPRLRGCGRRWVGRC
jgi:hypothetical protein